MNSRRFVCRLVSSSLALALGCALPLAAQQATGHRSTATHTQDNAASVTANPPHDANDKTYPIQQLLPLTVHDAWLLSGKNEEAFFDIVEQLAQFSAQKRNVSLPDTAEAGRRMGEMIKNRAKADHNQLLFAIVDDAVRTIGGPATAAAR